jgi:hypothetical protein
MKVRASVFSTCLLAGASPMVTASLLAQGYLTGAALNKKIVMDFNRVVFELRNVDLLDQYIAPDFVEHNSTVESLKSGGDRPRWPLSSRLFRSPLSTISARK